MYTKLKQLIAATLSVFLLGTMSPTTAFAADHTSIKPTQNDSILLNTNNSEVGIEFYNSEPVTIAKYQTASAWQSGRFYLKSDNSTLGEFKTVGEFTYDGTICNVTNCKNSVWNVADDPVYSKVPSKPYTDTISLLEVRRNQPSIEKLFARARVKLFTLITTSV